MRARCNGFTMVEALLVITIIVLLGGIVFALMGPARESARQRVCVSNLKQIGHALTMYIEDYDGTDPVVGQPMEYWELGLPPLKDLNNFLTDYVKNRQVVICPSYHEPAPVAQLGTTYAWCPSVDGFKPLPYRFSEVVRVRGGEAPVAVCYQHSHLDGAEPRWAQKKIIVLRANGRVQARMVPVRDYYPTF